MNIILDEGTLITFGECNYRILKCIGRGSSAVAYMAECSSSGIISACILKEYNPAGLAVSRAVLARPAVQKLLTKLFRNTLRPSVSNRFSSVNDVISIFEKLSEETERKDFVVPVLPHVSPFFTGRNKEINFISDKDLLCTFMMVNAWYFTAIEPEAEKVHEYIEKAAALAAEAYTNALELIDIFYIPAASCCFSLCEYETAVSLLSEAADICRAHTDILQYVDKLAELLRCLLDVYFENDDHEKCTELISEINEINEKYSNQEIYREINPVITEMYYSE